MLPYFPPHLWWLEMVSQEIAKYLVHYHNDVDIINVTSDISQRQRWYHIYHENWYEVICIPSFDIVPHFPCPKFRLPSFWQALKKIKTIQPDIVQTHTRFFLQTFLGGMLAKFRWIKRVHVEHWSWFVTWIPLFKKIVAWLYDQTLGRLVFRCCDQVVSINKANVAFISKFTRKDKIKVIYNGIQLPEIVHTSNKDLHLMFIGRLSPLKWVSLLIQACHQLLQKWIKNRKLSIVGNGEMKDTLLHDIQAYWLTDHISLLGQRAHDEVVTVLLPQTDIIINPSYQEGLPTCVLEGLLAKCVVVATDVGGTSEISDQKDLILVEKGSASDLQKGLEYAIQNHGKLRWLSYESVKERFDWKSNVEQYYEVYKKLV